MKTDVHKSCIACNKYVKMGSSVKQIAGIWADYIATGHYTRIVQCENKRYAVKKSVTDKKTRLTLYNLTQNQAYAYDVSDW